MGRFIVSKLSMLSTCLLLLLPIRLYPCTVFLLPQSPDEVVAVNMDWLTGVGRIFVNKRNVFKQSAFVSSPQTPLQWTSKYMSITFSQFGLEFPVDGMNEAGLSAHTLFSAYAIDPPTTDPRPAVNGLQWLQYILDTSANTAEAVANAQLTRVTGPFGVTEHYFVCDATGSCATFDYINGALVVKQGASLTYAAMSNNPYPQARTNLNQLLVNETPSQILALLSTDSLTRFAKGALLSTQYSPQNEEFSYAFSALNAVQESDTQWRIVFSLGNQSLQYETTNSSGLKYIDLRQFDPGCSSGVKALHTNAQISGDVTSAFFPFSESDNDSLVQANSAWLNKANVAILESYPSTTQCTETGTTLSSSQNPSAVGRAVNLTARVTGNGPTPPTGTVTFMNSAAALGGGTLDSTGAAQLTSTLPAGSNSLTAVYHGDRLNQPGTSSPLWQGVNVLPSQVTLSSSPNPATVRQQITLVATVSGQAPGVRTGTVALWDGSTVLGSTSLNSQGVANFRLSLPTGAHSLTAIYSGDPNNATSTSAVLLQSVNIQQTQTALISTLNPSDVGQPVPLTATVTGNYGAPPTGTVTFRSNGAALIPIVKLQSGQATVFQDFPSGVGVQSLTADYSGDGNSLPSTSSGLGQQVNPGPTQISLASPNSSYTVGQTVNITATVAEQYGTVPTGAVTFEIDGIVITTVAISNGEASFTILFWKAETQTVTAIYSGDSNNLPSQTSISIPVIQGQPTQTSLVSSLNPVSVNQTLTYAAKVQGQPGTSPTGTVTFYINGNVSAIVALSDGNASYSRTFSSAGSKIVTSTYSGDAINQPSASASLTQVVQ